jgi:hypothetical protein
MDEQDQNPRHLRKPDRTVQPVNHHPGNAAAIRRSFQYSPGFDHLLCNECQFRRKPSPFRVTKRLRWINLYLQALLTKSEIELKLSQCKIQ